MQPGPLSSLSASQAIWGGVGLIAWVAAWFLIFILFRMAGRAERIANDARLALVLASVAWGSLLTLTVEFASRCHQLNAPFLAASWVCVCATLAWGLHRLGVGNRASSQPGLGLFDRVREETSNLPVAARVMWLAAGLWVVLLGALAVLTPTTNWDSLTYHLARVMHWIQQGSVAHYPTTNTRQIELAPWSGFVQTHLFLFTGTDYLANLPQWFAMLGSAVVGTRIARQLHGADHHESSSGQLTNPGRLEALTFLLIVTLPIGMVESITTQNDYLVTFWMVCLASLSIDLWRAPANSLYLIGLGLALALGILTKATMFIYAAPLALALAWRWATGLPDLRLRWRWVGVGIGCLLLIDAPHLWRNFNVWASPLGSPYLMGIERNLQFSPSITLSNFLRNLTLHTNTGVPPLTDFCNAVLLWLHDLTGLALSDPRTTYHLSPFRLVEGFTVDDFYASCPVHVGLLFVAALLLVVCARKTPRLQLLYGGAVLLGVLLFCTFLRWQRWHARLHLGFLVLALPLATAVLLRSRKSWLAPLLALLTIPGALATLVCNQARPVFDARFLGAPREAQYLLPYGPALYQPLRKAADHLAASGCQSLGLNLEYDDAEYPLWVMLRNRGYHGSIHHVYVTNDTAQLATRQPSPEAVLSMVLGSRPSDEKQFPYRTDYGLAQVYWSARRDQWLDLQVVDGSTGTDQAVGARDANLPITKPGLVFEATCPRPGRLELQAGLGNATGPIQPLTLTIAAGMKSPRFNAAKNEVEFWVELTPLTNLVIDRSPFEMNVPLASGSTVLQFKTSAESPLPAITGWVWHLNTNVGANLPGKARP